MAREGGLAYTCQPTGQTRGQTRLVTGDRGGVSRALRNGQFVFVSSGQISFPKGELGFQRGLLVRGPDRHVMQVVE